MPFKQAAKESSFHVSSFSAWGQTTHNKDMQCFHMINSQIKASPFIQTSFEVR